MAFGGIGNLYWKDASADGRVIERVDIVSWPKRTYPANRKSSPLYSHLSEGMTITHLDDVFLGGKEDSWSAYLESEEVGDAGRGWCIARTLYEGAPQISVIAQTHCQNLLLLLV